MPRVITTARVAGLVLFGCMAVPAAARADCQYDYQCTHQLQSCEGSSYDSGCRQQFDSCVMTCRNSDGSSSSQGYSAPPPQFGAIAYSPSSRAHGYSYNYRDRGSAESIAMNYCRQNARTAQDCAVQIWFQTCGALATATDGSFGTGYGASPGQAEGYALAACSNYSDDCRVTGTVCNGPD